MKGRKIMENNNNKKHKPIWDFLLAFAIGSVSLYIIENIFGLLLQKLDEATSSMIIGCIIFITMIFFYIRLSRSHKNLTEKLDKLEKTLEKNRDNKDSLTTDCDDDSSK